VYWPGGSICDIENGSRSTVFFDDFDGDSLNADNWFTHLPSQDKSGTDSDLYSRTHCEVTALGSSDDDLCPQKQIYLDDNVVMNGDGTLSLLVKKEPQPITWHGAVRDYSSGVLWSKPDFSSYGRYEIRCDMPDGEGYWPNFWQYGWGFEFDVAEHSGDTDEYDVYIHNWDSPALAIDPDGLHYNHHFESGFNHTEGFQTYAVDYEPYRIRFWLNDDLITTIPRFSTLDGTPVSECDELPAQMLIKNDTFPRSGLPLHIIIDVSLWYYLDDNNFQPDECRIDYIKFEERDFPCEITPAVSVTMDTTRIWANGKAFGALDIASGGVAVLRDANYYFELGGSITVHDGGVLIIENATLTSCGGYAAWTGIVVESGGEVQVVNSNIDNAEVGVDLMSMNNTGTQPKVTIASNSVISNCREGLILGNGASESIIQSGTVFTGCSTAIRAEQSTGLSISGVNFTHNYEAIRAIDSRINFRNDNLIKRGQYGIVLEGTHPTSPAAIIGTAEGDHNHFRNHDGCRRKF